MKPRAVRRRVAADYLGVGISKIDELIAVGAIHAVKCGKSLLIMVASLDAYLDSLPAAKLALPQHLRREGSR
jgi:excisionase family DNA binding protein